MFIIKGIKTPERLIPQVGSVSYSIQSFSEETSGYNSYSKSKAIADWCKSKGSKLGGVAIPTWDELVSIKRSHKGVTNSTRSSAKVHLISLQTLKNFLNSNSKGASSLKGKVQIEENSFHKEDVVVKLGLSEYLTPEIYVSVLGKTCYDVQELAIYGEYNRSVDAARAVLFGKKIGVDFIRVIRAEALTCFKLLKGDNRLESHRHVRTCSFVSAELIEKFFNDRGLRTKRFSKAYNVLGRLPTADSKTITPLKSKQLETKQAPTSEKLPPEITEGKAYFVDGVPFFSKESAIKAVKDKKKAAEKARVLNIVKKFMNNNKNMYMDSDETELVEVFKSLIDLEMLK